MDAVMNMPALEVKERLAHLSSSNFQEA